MEHLELSSTERELLSQVLKKYLAALEIEIVHTDHSEFRALLKERRVLLSRIAARLEQMAPAVG
ncbi:MAG TPA: hypothetical protein PK640_17315 [Verrucomicrobiota bacterium]|nr:hypothetical protein [Verrucomicrobiota bacterium]